MERNLGLVEGVFVKLRFVETKPLGAMVDLQLRKHFMINSSSFRDTLTIDMIKQAKVNLQDKIRDQIAVFSSYYGVEVVSLTFDKYRTTTLEGNRQYYYDVGIGPIGSRPLDLRIEL